ncbi:hypothetical protein [Aliikangiella marina]|uniref:hypothetical protein n=1 Tax=Aliikangiella marina TaxID=1712262 RepID=UPI001AEDA704|nr:hypothetical protein [Aliikangiella marina]
MADLPDEIIEGVAIGNLKSISEQPAMLSNLAYSNSVTNTNLSQQNSVSNQQSMNDLVLSSTAKASNTISNLTPLEARSAVDILTNNELAQTIADLKSTLQAFSDTTDPSTGGSSGTKRNPIAIDFDPPIDSKSVKVVKDAGYNLVQVPDPKDASKTVEILLVPAK